MKKLVLHERTSEVGCQLLFGMPRLLHYVRGKDEGAFVVGNT